MKVVFHQSREPTNMKKQVLLISSYFTTCPGGGRGWGVGREKLKIKLNSAHLELELGLSLAICEFQSECDLRKIHEKNSEILILIMC
jgi:hypothetical protein